MKYNELWFLLGIAALLIICSGFFYQYSSTFNSFTSLNTENLSKFVDSGKELHLSSGETKQLLQLELEAADSRNKGMNSMQETFKHLSGFLFLMGGVQILLCILLYKRIVKLKHNQSLERDGA